MSGAPKFDRQVIEQFRANGGQVGGMFAGAPLVLSHTTGPNTGQTCTNPMMHLDLDDHRYVQEEPSRRIPVVELGRNYQARCQSFHTGS
jgi:hypothetical protein